MHTPTTTTREASGAAETTDSIIPGTPTHSNTTGPDGEAAPSASAARNTCCQPGTRRSLSIEPTAERNRSGAEVMCFAAATSYGEPSAGSTTTSAPQRVASPRRPDE